MLVIEHKEDCCGCSACEAVCPGQCITMTRDREGFLYPFVEKEKCVGCGLCVKVCPVRKSGKKNQSLKGYAVQNRNQEVLKESTSGGFFTELAEYVIKNGGVVFGAQFDKQFSVKHGSTDDEHQLYKFRNSKYCQSDINGTFPECKKILEAGRPVCYSGTPCQIEGLQSYLGKNYDHLITVDVACRGVPSPLLYEKYVEWNGGSDRISDIKFRDKHYGYFSSTMSVYKKNGDVQRHEIKTDPMLKFFFDNLCSRPSCYHCAFKTKDRVTDFTMFDCWHAGKFSPDLQKGGATALLIRTEKGKKIFSDIKNEFLTVEADPEELIALDGSMMLKSVKENEKRAEFFQALYTYNDFSEICALFQHHSLKQKVKLRIKDLMFRIGLFERYMRNRMKG